MDDAFEPGIAHSPPAAVISAVPAPGADVAAVSAATDTNPDAPADVHRHMARLFGRDSVYLVLWALQLGLAAVVTPIATRLLGTTAFGGVVAANAVMQVLFVVVCLGLSTGIEKRIFEPDGLNKARRLMTLSIELAVLCTAVAYATGPYWARSFGFDGFTPALRYAVLWAGISGVTACGLGMLRAQDRLLPFGIVSLVQSVVAEALSLALVTWSAATADRFVLGQLIAQVVATVWVLAAVRPAWVRRVDVGFALATLAFTIPLVPAMLSSFALTSANRLVIQKQLGEVQVARYQIAYNIGSIPILLLSLLNGAWMPRFFSLASARDRSALVAAARDALYRLLVPVILGLSLGAPLVLRVWAPGSYQPDRLMIVLFFTVVSTIPFAAGLSATRALLMSGHSGTIAVSSVLAAAVNIGLNVVLVDDFGLSGAAFASLVAYTVLYVLLEIRAHHALPTPRTTLPIMVALVASSVICWGLSLLPPTAWVLAVRGAGATACAAWFLVSARRLSRSGSHVADPAGAQP